MNIFSESAAARAHTHILLILSFYKYSKGRSQSIILSSWFVGGYGGGETEYSCGIGSGQMVEINVNNNATLDATRSPQVVKEPS